MATCYNQYRSDEIDSITVLKPAQAVALYGPSAINGAILIQTKRNILPEIITAGVGIKRKHREMCCYSVIVAKAQKADSLVPSVKLLFNKLNNLSVFPNPVKRGADFNLRIANSTGHYQMRLIDLNGNIITTKNIVLGNGKNIERIHCDENIATGPFFIHVIDEQGRVWPSVKLLVL